MAYFTKKWSPADALLTSEVIFLQDLVATSVLELPEISTPSTPDANYGKLYVKDSGGSSSIFFLSDDGTEYDLTSGGPGSSISLSVTPSGDVDGVNTVFTIPAQVSSLAVYSDGARAFPTDDYSVVVGVGITTITFVSGRQPSDESKGGSILVDYTV